MRQTIVAHSICKADEHPAYTATRVRSLYPPPRKKISVRPLDFNIFFIFAHRNDLGMYLEKG